MSIVPYPILNNFVTEFVADEGRFAAFADGLVEFGLEFWLRGLRSLSDGAGS